MSIIESEESFEQYLKEQGDKPGSLIPLLQKAQREYSYIPEEKVESIAEVTEKSISDVYGVITFYQQFRLTPLGENVIKVCDGTACHVADSAKIIETIEEDLGISNNETTDDNLFTLMEVACLGCCSLAPVMMINEETYGNLTPDKVREVLNKYKNNQ